MKITKIPIKFPKYPKVGRKHMSNHVLYLDDYVNLHGGATNEAMAVWLYNDRVSWEDLRKKLQDKWTLRERAYKYYYKIFDIAYKVKRRRK